MVPDLVVVFKLNGETRRLDYRKVPFSAWSELKAQLKFTPMSLLRAVQEFDLEAFGAIIWLERKQLERKLGWPEVRRELERGDCDFEPVDAIVDGVSTVGDDESLSEEPKPDPTLPNG